MIWVNIKTGKLIITDCVNLNEWEDKIFFRTGSSFSYITSNKIAYFKRTYDFVSWL